MGDTQNPKDLLSCGCFWHRDPDFGDVLTQCDAHKHGARYAGSEPMTPDEAALGVRAGA